MPSIAKILTSDYFVQDERRASWRRALAQEFNLPYMRLLRRKLLQQENEGRCIYPPPTRIFEALEKTTLPNVQVVIIGQDPYPQPGRAHGLAFSSENGDRHGSIGKIIKEVERNVGSVGGNGSCLNYWAEQGVLLLNAVLTVRAGCVGSHKGWGWECFTTRIIQTINREREHIVFMLWGKEAQRKMPAIDWHRHKLLTADHPTAPKPTRPFSGCGHFSLANTYLTDHKKPAIRW